jgi:LAS superfamily LD-carboxypeptidase LdcB
VKELTPLELETLELRANAAEALGELVAMDPRTVRALIRIAVGGPRVIPQNWLVQDGYMYGPEKKLAVNPAAVSEHHKGES